ncbi:hypothetical protein [Actinoplanes sp. NPDC049599]|uniref:hypothetical protein n=1 Tax=Actinoplanes sp. NPDC049599 TaxID=3363903 RepID=UPI0037AA59F9
MAGFLAGLISFKVKSRWCPHFGAMNTADLPAVTTPPPTPSAPSWAALPTQSYNQVGRAGALTPAQRRRANGGH